jgi:glycosyltransferase involved in cell wall biosynthesis
MTPLSNKDISCVIIVKNGEITITNTLASLSAFSEVVLYDNGSTDKTLAIAKQFANVRIIEGDFLGFGETKNKAASYAKNDWVLSLDADETLSEIFLDSLQSLTLDDSCAYQIVRTNFYRGREIKHCWKKEKIVRLYNRKITAFNDNKVHEFVLTNQLKVQTLAGLVNHFPYQSVADFIAKSNHYSSLFAQENMGKKHSSPLKAFLNATFVFIKKYFIKRGFLDGYPGLLISFAHMSTNFFKYLKLYEVNLDQEKKNRKE